MNIPLFHCRSNAHLIMKCTIQGVLSINWFADYEINAIVHFMIRCAFDLQWNNGILISIM